MANTKIYVSTPVKCVEKRTIDSETPKFVVYNGRREAKTITIFDMLV